MPQPKILFTSPVQPVGGCSPDVYSWDKATTALRVQMSFINHPGLAFLAANLPCQILEYPTPDQFKEALRDPPDILGISFYINETEIALKMVRHARSRGVKEVWAGNYGAYSPQVAVNFDRVLSGWGEGPVAEALGLPPIPKGHLIHPPIYGAVGTNVLPGMFLFGILYTSRGCPFTCNYCQTPDFYGDAQIVPLESIERVLWTYQRQGLTGVNILDENFGIFPAHTRAVIELLRRYRMRWAPLCRCDILLRHFEEWREYGLLGAHLGVESLNQTSLSMADKKLDHHKSAAVLRLLSRHNMFVQSFYIIGFEEETIDTIRRDILELEKLDIDVTQIQVITPYPRTEMGDRIRRVYGILDDNLSKYNSRNLVWNHPHIHPRQMKELQAWINSRLANSRRSLRTLSKLILYQGTARPRLDSVRLFAQSFRSPTRELYRSLRPRLQSAKIWGNTGWYAYEEVDQAAPTSTTTADAVEVGVASSNAAWCSL